MKLRKERKKQKLENHGQTKKTSRKKRMMMMMMKGKWENWTKQRMIVSTEQSEVTERERVFEMRYTGLKEKDEKEDQRKKKAALVLQSLLKRKKKQRLKVKR